MAEKEYIERETVRNTIKAVCEKYNQAYGGNYGGFGEELAKSIDNMPAADVYTEEDIRLTYNDGYSRGKADGIRDMQDRRQRGVPLTDNISRFVSAMVHKRKGKYGVEWVGIAGYEVVETIPYSADITECPLPFIFKMFVVVGSTKKRVEYKIKKETGKIDREIIQAERGKERQ